MKLLIAIPSKGRSDTIFKRTLRWVTRTGFDVRVFVEPDELETYREGARLANGEYYLDINDGQFVDIENKNGGLGYVNEFIRKYALENGYDLIFRMDDDVLRFIGRGRVPIDDKMIIDFCTMVAQCRKAFGRYKDLAAIGFPYRNELYNPKTWSLINARLQTCYIIRTEDMIGGYDSFSDFAQYIQIRANNRITLRYGLLGIDCAAIGKTAGGQKLIPELKQKAEKEIERLREVHPALKVKRVTGMHWDVEPVLAGEFFGVKKL